MGRRVFYVVMACLFVMSIAIGVATWMDRDRPMYWGKFTEQSTHCDPPYLRRGGCTITGTWVSDDGKTTLRQVQLDGKVAKNGTTRASYKPGGAMGANDIVHSPTRTHPELWLPWVLAAAIAAYTMLTRRKWRKRGEKPIAEADPAPVG